MCFTEMRMMIPEWRPYLHRPQCQWIPLVRCVAVANAERLSMHGTFWCLQLCHVRLGDGSRNYILLLCLYVNAYNKDINITLWIIYWILYDYSIRIAYCCYNIIDDILVLLRLLCLVSNVDPVSIACRASDLLVDYIGWSIKVSVRSNNTRFLMTLC